MLHVQKYIHMHSVRPRQNERASLSRKAPPVCTLQCTCLACKLGTTTYTVSVFYLLANMARREKILPVSFLCLLLVFLRASVCSSYFTRIVFPLSSFGASTTSLFLSLSPEYAPSSARVSPIHVVLTCRSHSSSG